MLEAIDDLVQRWQQNPDPATTVALCEALREQPPGALVRRLSQQVVEVAKERHASDASVMISVARMYMERAELADAQIVLVAAGRRAPRDARVYRWLGEVLLRRGDANRAERVLERAVQLDPTGGEAADWLERARSYRGLYAKSGAAAVAAEVERSEGRVAGADVLPRLSADADGEDETATTEIFERVHTAELEFVPTSAPRRPAASPGPVTSPGLPSARDVLDALALAGIFESDAAATTPPATWAAAAKGPKRRGAGILVACLVLFGGATVGVYKGYHHQRALDHVQAEALLSGVEARLHDADPAQLRAAEADLGQAFHLESRSRRAALDWTRERALTGLLKGGADVAFEDAMTRARELGVPEDRVAFARVASFLFPGDIAGAAAVLPRWERPAGSDAWFQLVAGATLERAGDPRARDRYAAAVALDPALYAARIALVRAAAIEGDAQEALRLARQLRSAKPDRAEPIALVALAWGRSPDRESVTAPPEAAAVRAREADLPVGLKFVPHAMAALDALDRRAGADARTEVRNALATADSPGVAVWLGTIALSLGDQGLARKAALAAVQLSAAYEPARALAARVALMGGRLDEALKATEELDPSAPDVAVVRAAAAYERFDADAVSRALEAVASAARKAPELGGLDLAVDALSGDLRVDTRRLLAMAEDDAPWADLVAMDVSLDAGDLSAADRIASRWDRADADGQPLRALRLARLARYEGRLDAAESLSEAALTHGTVTPRTLWERAYVLAARGHAADATLLVSRYPLVLGPLATWLSAYAAGASGAADAARAKVASMDPPPALAPFDVRVAAAVSFAAMKDHKRGVDYVKQLLATGHLNPDLVAAATALGFRRVEHGKRPPTYEL